MKRIVMAALVLAMSVLAAAPGNAAVIISSQGVEGSYDRLEYAAAADGKEFLVEVHGVPFTGMSQQAFEQELKNVLTAARPSFPAAQFTAHPTSAASDPSYRLVMVFGPAHGLSYEAQCALPQAVRSDPLPVGEVEVSVTFCRKGDVMSHAVARTNATGVNDPGFRQMFVELFPVLFPQDNPLHNGNN
jgi:hypothetical protein